SVPASIPACRVCVPWKIFHREISMQLSAMLTSLPVDFATALEQCRALGFTHVDIVGQVERPADDLEALADSGLLVSCASIGRDLPAGRSFDALPVAARQTAVDMARRQLDDAARLGATHAYIVPGLDAGAAGMASFTESATQLVAHAEALRMQLCLEHIPRRALPDAAGTLAWLAASPGLKLLLDIGHCLISGEDAAAIIRQAGPRLGYVHLDDNDGDGDLHWPLLAGKLTRASLTDTLTALATSGYNAAAAFELNPANPDPIEALRAGKELVEAVASAQ
ncbi:MAG: sugar phosphate isomerase/epimerase family protein, partial [Gemmataceae bacterium]